MLIDWFTVIAQIINFLILMWLLKHFLYKPVLNAIDVREKRIADEVALAKKIETSATKQKIEYEQKNRQFDLEHVRLLEQVKADAERTKQQMLQDARNEILILRQQWQQGLHKQQLALTQGIETAIQQQVLAISRKVLQQLADSDLESRIVEKFTQQIRNLNDEDIAQLCITPQNSDCRLIVRSAFDLNSDQQSALTSQLHQVLSLNKAITFEVEPDLLSGIELISNGHKVAWNIADYLTTFEQSLASLLKTYSAGEREKTHD